MEPQYNNPYAPLPIIPKEGKFGSRFTGYHRYPFNLTQVEALSLNEVDTLRSFVTMVHDQSPEDYQEGVDRYDDPLLPNEGIAENVMRKLATWIFFYMHGIPTPYEDSPALQFSSEEVELTKKVILFFEGEHRITYPEGFLGSSPFDARSIARHQYDLVDKWLAVADKKAKEIILLNYKSKKIGEMTGLEFEQYAIHIGLIQPRV